MKEINVVRKKFPSARVLEKLNQATKTNWLSCTRNEFKRASLKGGMTVEKGSPTLRKSWKTSARFSSLNFVL